MKRKNPLAVVGAWLALALAPNHSAHGADSALSTGTITGRVQNIVTGRYLSSARVSVQQTDIVSMTDAYGGYILMNVPSGPNVIEVYYTGLDLQRSTVNVPAGARVTQDFELSNASLFGAQDSTVKLDPFIVASSKETDGAAIAINEQRFAPNIKNVVSTDTHGEVMGGNLGEFLKFIPGVDSGAGGFEPGSISIRGFDPSMTLVTNDGAPLANSGDDRSFTLEQVSINNLSRVEVTKVPTPSTPADSMSGSVNMISKSSFERKGSLFRYNVSLTGSGNEVTLSKLPDVSEKKMYRTVPSFNFDYTLPINKDLGIVITGMHYRSYVDQNWSARAFQTTGAGTGATFSTPYFRQHTLTDSPQYRVRNSGSMRVDWRVTPHSVLSATFHAAYYQARSGNFSFLANAGTNPAPSVAGGVPLGFGPDFTIGATGRGAISQGGGGLTRHQLLGGGHVNYRFDNGDWMINALVTDSGGKSWSKSPGKFGNGIATATKVPVRVTFRDIDDIGPGRVEVFTNTNEPFDIYDINNYNLTAAGLNRRDLQDSMRAGQMNVRRNLSVFSIPTAVQLGGAHRKQTRDLQNNTINYTYNGINGDRSAAPYVSQVYKDLDRPLISSVERDSGGRSAPYVSPYLAWDAFLKNPSLFTSTPAQIAATERTRRNNSLYFEEKVDALYLQAEMRFLSNRLNVLTGVRYEKTGTYGVGVLNDPAAVFLRNADGSFARNAAGARIRRPEAGAAGSLAEVDFTHVERGYSARRTYDGYYPSVHLTYNITNNFIARAAYAKTYGRPNYSEIVPNTVINENDLGVEPDPNQVLGTLSVRNTGLRPWRGDNYDVTLEYYTDTGGLFGVSLFYKEIGDFFGTFAKIATVEELAALGLGPEYAGWQVNTRINAGDARVSGVELSLNQSLQGLGGWGRQFRVFANTTKIKTAGANEADFSGFLPTAVNAGFTFSRKPLIFMTKLNYRGLTRNNPAAAAGPDGYGYAPARIQCDVNLDYQLRSNLSLFLNVRNLFNSYVMTETWGSETPEYAKRTQTRDYGAVFSVGVKGSF